VDINVGSDFLGLCDQRSYRHNGFFSQWLWCLVVIVVVDIVVVPVLIVVFVVVPSPPFPCECSHVNSATHFMESVIAFAPYNKICLQACST